MKSDRQIQKDVIDQLGFDPSISADKIGVAVKDGIVTLTGAVPSFAEKYQAEWTARHVNGVKSVVEKIKAELPGTHVRSDFDIAEAAVNALKWDIFIPQSIQATVEDGVVKLTGDVEWGYQRDSAVSTVRRLIGVKDVTNLIRVVSKPKIKASDIKDTIEKALTRSAREEVHQIKVEVKDDKVILTGKVRSVEESQDARWAAWSVPGISKVENNLLVA